MLSFPPFSVLQREVLNLFWVWMLESSEGDGRLLYHSLCKQYWIPSGCCYEGKHCGRSDFVKLWWRRVGSDQQTERIVFNYCLVIFKYTYWLNALSHNNALVTTELVISLFLAKIYSICDSVTTAVVNLPNGKRLLTVLKLYKNIYLTFISHLSS